MDIMIEIKQAKKGSCILYNDKPYRVEGIKSVVVSKHSHSKTKVSLTNVFDREDRQTITLPNSEIVEEITVIRKHGQYIARLGPGKGQVMDMRDYSLFEVEIQGEIDGKIKEGDEVTYIEFSGRSKILEIR
jgi:translation elongation factor P/translation initiation factor 5A